MCRELPRSGGISRFRALCITISDDRGDESFADDLNKGRGIVSGRVALLLRSTEIRPHRPNDLSRPPGGGVQGQEGREGRHLAKFAPRLRVQGQEGREGRHLAKFAPRLRVQGPGSRGRAGTWP